MAAACGRLTLLSQLPERAWRGDKASAREKNEGYPKGERLAAIPVAPVDFNSSKLPATGSWQQEHDLEPELARVL